MRPGLGSAGPTAKEQAGGVLSGGPPCLSHTHTHTQCTHTNNAPLQSGPRQLGSCLCLLKKSPSYPLNRENQNQMGTQFLVPELVSPPSRGKSFVTNIASGFLLLKSEPLSLACGPAPATCPVPPGIQPPRGHMHAHTRRIPHPFLPMHLYHIIPSTPTFLPASALSKYPSFTGSSTLSPSR